MCFLFLYPESDGLLRCRKRFHQFANGVEESADLSSLSRYASFQFIEFLGEMFAIDQEFAKPRKRTHDLDARFYGDRGAQDRCKHDRAVLCESVRELPPSASM